MRVAVEVRRRDHLHREVERVVVDQDRAEHGTLGFEIVRKRALRGSECVSAMGGMDGEKE